MVDNQKGTALTMAIGIASFLAILIAAILPMVTNGLRHSGIMNSILASRAAAEAGAKVAIVALCSPGGDNPLADGWLNIPYPVITGSGATYTITAITSVPPLQAFGSPPPNQYTIIAVGTAGGVAQTVQVTVDTTKSPPQITWTEQGLP
jgi:hypothetical protein